MINFTVNPILEHAFEWYLYGIGTIIWSTLVDLNAGLVMPMPLFPLPGGYCTGLLCQAGISTHYLVVLCFFVLFGTFFSMGLSIFYRHQLILPRGHWLRIRKEVLSTLFALFCILIQAPSFTLLLGIAHDGMNIQYLEENHPAMLWLAKKDNWVVYDPNSLTLRLGCYEVAALSIILPTLYFGIALHLYRGISLATFMSIKTRTLHTRIVMVLIGQVLIFCVFLIIPFPIFILSMYTEQIGHEINLSLFAMLLLYSWTHSIVLIATTPSYQAALSKSFHSLFSKFSCRTVYDEESRTLRLVTKATSNEDILL